MHVLTHLCQFSLLGLTVYGFRSRGGTSSISMIHDAYGVHTRDCAILGILVYIICASLEGEKFLREDRLGLL